jgi:hypothetical protein
MNRVAGEIHRKKCETLFPTLIEPLREVARANGYALGVHGSLAYDLDLIAVPWSKDVVDARIFAEAIRAKTEEIAGYAFQLPYEDDEYFSAGCPGAKPHGRLVWSFHVGGGPYIDLSVIPSADSKGQAVMTRLDWIALKFDLPPGYPMPPWPRRRTPRWMRRLLHRLHQRLIDEDRPPAPGRPSLTFVGEYTARRLSPNTSNHRIEITVHISEKLGLAAPVAPDLVAVRKVTIAVNGGASVETVATDGQLLTFSPGDSIAIFATDYGQDGTPSNPSPTITYKLGPPTPGTPTLTFAGEVPDPIAIVPSEPTPVPAPVVTPTPTPVTPAPVVVDPVPAAPANGS